jgi:hypothetical protein
MRRIDRFDHFTRLVAFGCMAFLCGVMNADRVGRDGERIAWVIALGAIGLNGVIHTVHGLNRWLVPTWARAARALRELLDLELTPEQAVCYLHRTGGHTFQDLTSAVEAVLGLPNRDAIRLVVSCDRDADGPGLSAPPSSAVSG